MYTFAYIHKCSQATHVKMYYTLRQGKNRPTESLLRQGENNPRVLQTCNHSLGRKVHSSRTMNEAELVTVAEREFRLPTRLSSSQMMFKKNNPYVYISK